MKTTKVLFYCTMGKPYLYKDVDNKFKLQNKEDANWINKHLLNGLNGKVVAECEVETEEIRLSEYPYYTDTLTNDELLDKSCLDDDELDNYITDKHAYALHIKNLKIFDNPKYIFDYYKRVKEFDISDSLAFMPVQKAPQNMMKVYDKEGNSYVVISIRSPWLCKIFNGEKEIEVRTKVMKEMLSNETNVKLVSKRKI